MHASAPSLQSPLPEPATAQHHLQPEPVDLSVVLPFCNEAGNLPELLRRLHGTLKRHPWSYELIFVDDGSTDDGPAVVARAAERDPRIKLAMLSRNFGQHVAASAGIDLAIGDMVVWMDSDLQERPEDIPRLILRSQEGFDIVHTHRRTRRQSPGRAMVSNLGRRLLNRLVGIHTSPNESTMCLLTRPAADALRDIPERNRFMGYLLRWSGFEVTSIQIEVDPRTAGRTHYSMWKLIRLACRGLTSFSVVPLRLSALFAIAALLVCLASIVWVLYRYWVYGIAVTGWASLILAILALHASQFVVLAILGEYVGLVYTETKRRPLYFLRKTINLPRTAAPPLRHGSLRVPQ